MKLQKKCYILFHWILSLSQIISYFAFYHNKMVLLVSFWCWEGRPKRDRLRYEVILDQDSRFLGQQGQERLFCSEKRKTDGEKGEEEVPSCALVWRVTDSCPLCEHWRPRSTQGCHGEWGSVIEAMQGFEPPPVPPIPPRACCLKYLSFLPILVYKKWLSIVLTINWVQRLFYYFFLRLFSDQLILCSRFLRITIQSQKNIAFLELLQ